MKNGLNGELILYETEDGTTKIHLRQAEGTVWLTQSEIAELFDATKQNVSLHLKNIFEDKELSENSVVKDSLTTAGDGKQYIITYYNLETILAIGYRVRSPRGAQFRRWASTILQEYLIKGFVLDDNRLKEPDAQDYFDELLSRIRDIRASEKRFYQKVRDLFAATSMDYSKNSEAAKRFFKTIQNKLIYAVTGLTAAELVVEQTDQFLVFYGREVLKSSGSISNVQMEKIIADRFKIYDTHMRKAEAVGADIEYEEDWCELERDIQALLADKKEKSSI